jgi:predicted phosphoribosyltransferase
VASRAAISALSAEADETHCLLVREDFTALEEWYADFRRVSDDSVRTLCAAWHPA